MVTSDDHFSMCSLAICRFYFVKCPCVLPVFLLLWGTVNLPFLSLIFKNSLFVLDVGPLSDICIVNFFPQPMAYLLIFFKFLLMNTNEYLS